MPDKYRWNYTVGWAVEYVRHDAEVWVEVDDKRQQFVIAKGCASNEHAQAVAEQFCEELHAQIAALITNRTQHLKPAKE